MTYRLFKTQHGIKQVPVREDEEFNDFDYDQQIPEEAKGEVRGEEAPFVEQTRNQKRNLTKSMTDQVAFQQSGLQWSNQQPITISIASFSTGSLTYIDQTYNDTTAFGTYCAESFVFDDYVNINYMECSLRNANVTIENDSYMSFYVLQKTNTTPNGTGYGEKIPTQLPLSPYDTDTNIQTSGVINGAQSILLPFNTPVAFSNQSELKGVRCHGLALKNIIMDFPSSIDTAYLVIDLVIYVNKESDGQNY